MDQEEVFGRRGLGWNQGATGCDDPLEANVHPFYLGAPNGDKGREGDDVPGMPLECQRARLDSSRDLCAEGTRSVAS